MHAGRRRSSIRMLIASMAVVANLAAFAPPANAATLLLSDNFTGTSTAPNATRWKTWWGTVTLHNDVLSLRSTQPTTPSKTYSALLTSRKGWSNYTFTYDQTNVSQLRTGSSPNTWEVGWAMFRFRDLANFYDFILKPNGWELGKKQGSDTQIFLATGEAPSARIGYTDHIKILVSGSTITVWVDGAQVVRFTDQSGISSGAIGLYEEDSHVHFDRVYVYSA